MDLRFYVDILRRRLLIIIIVVAMALTVITLLGLIRTPVYQAEATVRILLDPGIQSYLRGSDFNDRLIRTYENMLTSIPVLDAVLNNLMPRTSSMSVLDLRRQLEVEIISDTELIKIIVQDEDPLLARDMANMFGTALIEYAGSFYVGNRQSVTELLEMELGEIQDELDKERIKLDELLASDTSVAEVESQKTRIKNLEISQELRWREYETARLAQNLRVNSIVLVQPASIPNSPVNTLGLRDVALTLVLGLAGGVTLALIIENMDVRIRSLQQLERLSHASPLGSVPRGILSLNDYGQIVEGNIQGLAEAYRLAALNLQQIAASSSVKTILITSANSNEGKTIVAINLGRVLAERGKTVFLVEADMRRPSLDEKLQVDNGHVGLSSWLASLSSLDQVIGATEQPTLFVIGSGPVPPNPVSLLASPSMDRLLDYFGNQGQLTLIDAPPVLGVADVSILVPKVDGVILVVHQDLTSPEQLNDALKQLEAAQVKMLCSILVLRGKKGQKYIY